MQKHIFRILSTLLLLSYCSDIICQPEIKSGINKSVILIGEKAIISVSANVANNTKVTFPTYDSLQTIIPGVEVLSQNDTIQNIGSNSVYTRKYHITSFDTATYSIPSIDVTVDGTISHTEPIELKVESVDIDTTHVEKIFDLKEPMEPAFDIKEWVSPLLLSIFTFLVSIILTYIIIRIKDNKPIMRRFRFSAYIPPHKTALNEINKLKQQENIQAEDSKAYYTKLTDILRKYIEGRYGFNAMEMTTDEIVQHLKEVNDENAVIELHDLFSTADLVKFAKAQPDISSNDKNLLNAISYIQNTKKEEIAEQAPKEVVVEDIRSKKTKKILYVGITLTSLILLITTIYLIQYIFVLNY